MVAGSSPRPHCERGEAFGDRAQRSRNGTAAAGPPLDVAAVVYFRCRPRPPRRARSAKASSAAVTSGERQTRLRGPELVSRRIPASDKGSRYRRACFDSMPNSTVSSDVLMTGRPSRRSAICHTAESLRAVIFSFHSARMARKSLTSRRPLKTAATAASDTRRTIGAGSPSR